MVEKGEAESMRHFGGERALLKGEKEGREFGNEHLLILL